MKTDKTSSSCDSPKNGLGLYIHWPFCQSKCPYCDFNSHVRQSIDEQAWEEALLQELAYVGQLTKGQPLTSVFFGGGTPSLMPARTVQKLLEALATHWAIDPGLEITLEGNPNSIEVSKYRDFKAAGINRVSVGIQSLRQDSLTFLGRLHNADEAKRALEITSTLFDRSSFDLIYTLPNQTLKEWKQELEEALTFARGHLSLYQLIIEPGTAFHTRYQRGDFQLPNEKESAELYELTRDIVGQQGYETYEVSNYAQQGHQCRHNTLYWTYGDYVCIGPGAHGRVSLEGKKNAIKNYKAPETWLEKVKEQGHGQEISDLLTAEDQVIEHLLMGLRLKTGIHKESFHKMHGVSLTEVLDPKKVTFLKDLGFLDESKTHFYVTPSGLLRLNTLTSELVTTLKSPSRSV